MEIIQKLGFTCVVAPPSSFHLFFNPYNLIFSLRLGLYPLLGPALLRIRSALSCFFFEGTALSCLMLPIFQQSVCPKVMSS
jgi:hypothetical protein